MYSITSVTLMRSPLTYYWIFGLILIYPMNWVFGASETVVTDTGGSELVTMAPLSITIGDVVEELPYDTYHSWFHTLPYLTYTTENPAYDILRQDFCPFFREPCTLRHDLRAHESLGKVELRSVDVSLIDDYLVDVSERVLREPVDAILGMEGDTIVILSPDSDGLVLDPLDNTPLIAGAIERGDRSVVLQTSMTPARIRADNFEETLGLREVIGEGRSDFGGSSPDRIHNISTAASKFNGMIIPPGEEFSFVENLGAVDGTTGYKKELVIRNNQTTPEYGGGVCQVSTTIFRGAVLSGMEITERRNHSYPIKYYEPIGFDATIYLPAPDIKFKNNTTNHIMISSRMEGTELVYKFFGTKDGRSVVMDGPHVTEENPDGSMKTYFVQKVTDSRGEMIVDKTFYSNYKSPKDFPKTGDTSLGGRILTEKPKDWSKKQWKAYVKENDL